MSKRRGRVQAGSDASPPKIPNSFTRPGRKPPKNPGWGNQQGSASTPGFGSGGSKGNGGSSFYGAYGGYKGVPLSQAQRLVQSMIRPELRALRSDRRQIRRDANSAATNANTLYGRSVGDLNHIFGESSEFIDQKNAAANQAWDQSKTSSQVAQSALAAQLAASGVNNAQAAEGELARLGISGSGDMGAYTSDQNYAQSTAALSGANNMANLDAMAANTRSIGELVSGMNQGSKASNLGQVLNTRNDTLSDISAEKLDGFSQVRDAMREVRGGRKDLMIQLLQQLSETGWAQYMDQQGLNMQRRSLRGSGGSGGSYGGGGGSSSGGSSGESSGYYGGKVDAMIDALAGGGVSAPPKGPKGKGPKKPPKKPPFMPGTVLSGF